MKRITATAFLALLTSLSFLCGCLDLTIATPKEGGEDTAGDADTDADTDTDGDADTDADSDSDGDSDGDSDSDADTDTDTDVDTDADTDPDCQGEIAGQACWYLGDNAQSCDDVCQNHNGYDEATKTYAGSDGTDANCEAVLTALGKTGTVSLTSQGYGTGCFWSEEYTQMYRDATNETTADASQDDMYRACACNN